MPQADPVHSRDTTTATRSPDHVWFTQARFGIFIHFGLYAVHGKGEDHHRDGWTPKRYANELLPRFDPAEFDARQWVAMCQGAGARYLVLTSKHGEGFCLWPTHTTDFSVANTPLGRDIVGELAGACHDAGMRFGLYYATDNWHYSESGRFEQSVEAYSAFVREQLHELMTRYGQVDVLWFDGSTPLLPPDQLKTIVNECRGLQPTMVVNDRGVHHNATGDRSCGDFVTPERFFPERISDSAPMVEVCDAMGMSSWGYTTGARFWSPTELIARLCQAASIGANYLLNVEPEPTGRIRPECVDRLEAIGAWVQRHRDAVFDVEPFSALAFEHYDQNRHLIGRCTRRGKNVHVLLDHAPRTDQLRLPYVTGEINAASITDGEQLHRLEAFVDEGDLLVRALPCTRNATNAVITLTFADRPHFDRTAWRARCDTTIDVSSDGPTQLHPTEAQLALSPDGIAWNRIESYANGTVSIGRWVRQSSGAAWRISVTRAGRFRVFVHLGATEHQAGAQAVLDIGGHCLRFETVETGGYHLPTPVDVGQVQLTPGNHVIRLSGTLRRFFPNVHGITIIPT